jgi:type I restriction enzyme S subunit
MRNGWTETTLGDVAEVLDRMRKPVSGAEREKRQGPVPYYGATGQAGWIDAPIFDEELVLLGEDAIDFLNPLVHKAYLISGPSWVNNHAHVLRARRERVLAYFLMEALNAVDYSRFVAFGTRSKLTQSAMMDITINLPPLAEQKRIVDVVSSVDAYIDALQQQADTARTARNAVLHELLSAGGDDWTETTLGKVAELISRGRAPSYCEEDGVIVLNQKCVRNGRIIFEFARRTDTSKKAIPEWAYLKTGDTLINSTGVGTLGRASFVSSLNGPTTFDSHVTLVRPLPDSCLPLFIGLNLNFRESEIEMFAGGSTGQTELSREAVNSFPIILPSLEEQKRIVEIVSSMDEVILSTEQAVVDAKNLRSGLLSDLLSGEHEIPASYDVFVGAA